MDLDRNNIFKSTFSYISQKTPAQLIKGKFKITFTGERGID
jgi:hypothetical protein